MPDVPISKVPAYFTAAFDLDGSLKIQQIQYREVLNTNGVLRDLGLLPIELLHVVNQTPHDVVSNTLQQALGEVAALAVQTTATMQVQHDQMVTDLDAANTKAESLTVKLAEATATQTNAEAERDAAVEEAKRLRTVLSVVAPDEVEPAVQDAEPPAE